MIEAAIEWNEKNISDYVKYTVFGKNKSTKVYIALYAVFMALIAVVGVASAVITGIYWLLAASVVAVLLIAVFSLVLLSAVKKYTKDIFNVNSDNKIDGIEITASCIILKREGVSRAIIEWQMMATADFTDVYAFLTTSDGILMIIEKKNIKQGSLDELKQIVDEKMVKQGD